MKRSNKKNMLGWTNKVNFIIQKNEKIQSIENFLKIIQGSYEVSYE